MLGRKALTILATTLAALLFAALPAYASSSWYDGPRRHQDSDSWSHGHSRGHSNHYWWAGRNGSNEDSDDDSDDSSDDSSDSGSDSSSDATVAPASGTVVSGAEKTVTAELTAYSHEDNQGGNNARICCAVLHREAGGTGTFADPITTAVPGSGSSMETKAGTKIYIPALSAYFIVEDSGATPTGKPRFDLWMDGRGLSSASSCMDKITRTTTVIINAAAGKSVGRVGPLADSSGCHVA